MGLAALRVGSDLRFAIRLFARRPGFALLAIVTFAIGIGAATAIYSVVEAVLIRPLPYSDPDRIVQIINYRMEKTVVRSGSMSRPQWLALREQARTLAVVGAYDSYSNVTRRRLALSLETGRGTAELLGTRISPQLLSILGVNPVAGRGFDAAEERVGANAVIMLSYSAWQSRFGGDPQVIAKTLRLDGRSYEVVGVMPEGFAFPDAQTDFWIPLTPAPPPSPSAPRADSPDSAYADGVFARLVPGVSAEAAQAEVSVILRSSDRARAAAEKRTPEQMGFPASMPIRAEVRTMKDEFVATARPLLRVLTFAVVCILGLACANVVNLLLAGAMSRERERATRVALGASRWQLIRQALCEGLVLSLAGGVMSLPLAYLTMRLIARLAPADLPRFDGIGVDPAVLLSAAAFAVTAGIVAGVLPALTIVRRRRLEWLVSGEIALALVLLAGAGLLTRSFLALNAVSLGFDERDVVAFQIVAPSSETDPRASYARIVDGLRSLPGVDAAGATDVLPLVGSSSFRFTLGGLPEPPGPQDSMVMRLVTSDYFRAMGIRFVGGRSFSAGAAAAREVIVSQAVARRFFGGRQTLGRTVGTGFDTYTVVGVVADVRHNGRLADVEPEYYMSLADSGFGVSVRPYFVVRTPPGGPSVVPALRERVLEVAPGTGVASVVALSDLASDSVARPRFNTTLMAIFAGIAVMLAAVAIYGVLVHAITQRTRDIAVRVAVGAGRADVLRLVFRHGALMAGAGILVGSAGAAAATRYLDALLFGVVPLDAFTFAASALAFVVVTVLAAYVPARRALRIDPAMALRSDA